MGTPNFRQEISLAYRSLPSQRKVVFSDRQVSTTLYLPDLTALGPIRFFAVLLDSMAGTRIAAHAYEATRSAGSQKLNIEPRRCSILPQRRCVLLSASLELSSRVVQDSDEFEADQIRVSEHEVELQRMIDDMGFGDMGLLELNAIRGYSTPAINEFADEGMRLARMYTEPSCTPTR